MGSIGDWSIICGPYGPVEKPFPIDWLGSLVVPVWPTVEALATELDPPAGCPVGDGFEVADVVVREVTIAMSDEVSGWDWAVVRSPYGPV